MLREIELCTSDGGFVAVVDVLPFPDKGMPRVVVWGSRTFWLDPERVQLERWVYSECFAVVSLTESPGRPRTLPESSGSDYPSSGETLLSSKAREKGGPTSPVPPVDRSARTTLHGADPNTDDHRELDPATGMQKDYVVLTEEERRKGFVRPVRRSYTHSKCGQSTRMGLALCETYARDPGFYTGTFCSTCGRHFPVGADGEFTWDGTTEKVGT